MHVFTPPRVCLYNVAFIHIFSTKQHLQVHLYNHVRMSLHVYTPLYPSLQPVCVQLYNLRARIYNAACTCLQGLTSCRPDLSSRRHVNKEAYGLSSVHLKS